MIKIHLNINKRDENVQNADSSQISCEAFTNCSPCIQAYFMIIRYNKDKVEEPCFKSPNPQCFVDFTSPCSYVALSHSVMFFIGDFVRL